MTRPATGIEARHAKDCPIHRGGRCNRCGCGFRAEVWSRSEGRRIRKTFPTLDAAKSWRTDAIGQVRRGHLQAGKGKTLHKAAEAWLEGVKAGSVLNRSGDPYKPSVLRSYRASLRLHVLPKVGAMKLAEIERPHLQKLVSALQADGLDPSSVKNAINPVRAIFRHAVAHGDVATNPTPGLHLPAVRGKRGNKVDSPTDAAALIAAAPEQDRAIWATALYAGLRLGELQALRWRDLDFSRGLIRVERSWDAKAGPVEPKSAAGRRRVPMPAALRTALEAHRDFFAATSDALVFARPNGKPFHSGTIPARARRAWQAADMKPIGLHEARHAYASMMIAAGANAKALQTYMGHSSITTTMDRYGHLMEGNEAEAAQQFDAYLAMGQSMGQ